MIQTNSVNSLCNQPEALTPTSGCNTAVNSRTLTEFPNTVAAPVLTTGPVTLKVPVVLAERTIQIDVESHIKLDQPAVEIKRIRKNIYLTQCKLLPTSGKLFLSGFIRKNIEYATAQCSFNGTLVGDIRHTTVNVPFEGSTLITFTPGTTPIFTPTPTALEFEIFDPKLMGKNPREFDSENFEHFNEKIFCELISSRIIEEDLIHDGVPLNKDYPHEIRFQNITEKSVILLTLKLLQNQQVQVIGLAAGV